MRRSAWLAVVVALTLMSAAAWAYWSAGSVPGGGGAAAASAVNQGARPTVSLSGRAITVTWAGSTLSNGQAVDGYVVKRYDAVTASTQTVGSGCAGTVTATSCTENAVPSGQWVYTVTPTFATNWRGAESVKSTTVTVAAPTLSLQPTTLKPGASLTGSVGGFLAGETLRFRLDASGGTELSGSLAGSATPATVPAAGGGAAVVTVPAGTTDGTHSVFAVASPSGDAASVEIVVDSTAPPVPVLTSTPASVSGDTVSFAFTEAEASASVECRLDTAAFGPCTSPVDYSGLGAGSHTFQARATDTVGNTSASASYTWTVNTSVPNIFIAFPGLSGLYNDSGFNAGCGTAAAGDVCGSADDDLAVVLVNVSLRRLGTGLWWTGTGFTATTETWLLATGTTDWTFAVDPSTLPEGDYTLRARASDGVNLGYDARTFTIDRTAPAAPAITSGPPATSAASATFAFATADTTASYECRLDSGSFTACTSPRALSSLTDGSHTFSVRALDGAGNISTITSSTWTVDATAPTAGMTFPTATRVNLAGWTAGCGTPAAGDLCGTATDAGSGVAAVAVAIRRASTYTYWDGSGFASSTATWLTASGTSAWSYLFAASSFPADGNYTMSWRATDAVGNSTTGAVDLVIDTTPPPAPVIVKAPSNPSGDGAQFDFTVAEAGTAAQCQLDAGAWAGCSAPVGYTGLADGSHTFRVRATDAAGNVSPATSHTWTVDVGLPSVNISFPGAVHAYNDATYAAGCGTAAGDICGTASDPQGDLASVALSIRRTGTSLYWTGTSFASATEVFLPASGTSTWSFAMPASSFPAEGTYVLRASATDGAGNIAVDTVNLTIDRTAPAAPTITSGPTDTTAGSDTFAFTGEPDAAFECRLDASAWAACTSPKPYASLADGSHTFDVRAVDAAGNTGAATSRTWTVDASAPSIGTTFPAAGARYTAASYDAGCVAGIGDICGTSSDTPSGVAKVEISMLRASTGLYLVGTTFSSATQNWITATGTTSWNYALAATTFPADGTYTLAVRATDNVGNARTTTTTFVVDRTKPTGTGFTTTNAAIARKLDQGDTFTLTYSEAVTPASVLAGWNGTTTQNVVVRATNSSKDRLTVYNATNTTLLPLGTINLKRSDYVTAAMTFGLSGTASTMTMSGSSVTLTLGTPSGTPTVAAAAANVTWTPAAGVTDLAGNACATTNYTETDLDNDF